MLIPPSEPKCGDEPADYSKVSGRRQFSDELLEPAVLAPGTTVEEAAKRTWALHHEWRTSSALGKDRPVIDARDYAKLREQVYQIGREAARVGDADVKAPPSPVPANVDVKPEAKPGTHAPSQSVGLNPGAKAVAAAYALVREKERVSIKSVCERANICRKNLKRRYPEVIRIIETMSTPGRNARMGTIDRRTGRIDAVDEYDE